MSQVELVAQPRSVTGKRVKALRAAGLVPLVVYGPKTRPINVQAPELDVRRALARARGQLITLRISGQKPRPVLVKEAQRDPISGRLLHADLYEVDVTERQRVEVAIELVGEPHMVNTGQAVLNQPLTVLTIECLPTMIMQSIPVDVSGLTPERDAVHVRDLSLPEGITVLTPGDEVIARMEVLREEEEEEEEELIPETAEVEVIRRGRVEEEE